MRERFARLMELADGTKTPQQVADLLGKTRQYVGSLSYDARREGLAPKFRPEREKWRRIIEFCAKGDKTVKDVAEHFAMTESHVRSFATDLFRKRGIHIRLKDRATRRSSLINELPPEIVKWLVDQTPAGCTIDDVIRGIVTDAYHDEVSA